MTFSYVSCGHLLHNKCRQPPAQILYLSLSCLHCFFSKKMPAYAAAVGCLVKRPSLEQGQIHKGSPNECTSELGIYCPKRTAF